MNRHMRSILLTSSRVSFFPRSSSLLVLSRMSAAIIPTAPVRHKVYTKTGDEGSSSLYNGKRRPKDDTLFSALGDVDELNASIGLAREYCAVGDVGLENQLVEIQSRLLDVGSAIATPASSSSTSQLARVVFPLGMAAKLETWIDEFDKELPPLTNFILPVSGCFFEMKRYIFALAHFFLYISPLSFPFPHNNSLVVLLLQHFMFLEQSVDAQNDKLSR